MSTLDTIGALREQMSATIIGQQEFETAVVETVSNSEPGPGGSAGSRDEFVSLSVRATPFAFVTFRWETAVSDPPVLSTRRGEVPSWRYAFACAIRTSQKTALPAATGT